MYKGKMVKSINKGGDIMYGIQVRIGSLRYNKPQNAGRKPQGGIWTSSLLEDKLGSAWTVWCEREDYNLPKDGIWKAYLLQPNEDARIYTIDSLEDLQYILNKYKSRGNINYKKARKDYDAIHLTWKGQGATYWELYGWDIESTIWLNEAYTVIEEVMWKVET